MDRVLEFNSQTEGQDSLRQTVMCDYSNESNEKNVKETVPTWSQNWFFLQYLHLLVELTCASALMETKV